jgi:DNA-binding transcriptional regulator/RsmH inhibitor MraZ
MSWSEGGANLDQISKNPVSVVEMPRSMSRARIDDKGRIKLPAGFLHFFEALPEKKVFVTSLDGLIAEIYPISTWREMEKFFAANQKLGAARRASFTAARLGTECEVDGQGRVTINSELRAELALDNQELHVQPYNLNRIRILSASAFEESMRDIQAADPKQDEEALLDAGRP